MPLNQKIDSEFVIGPAIKILLDADPSPLNDPQSLLFITKRLITAEWNSAKSTDSAKAVFLRQNSLAKIFGSELGKIQASNGGVLTIAGQTYNQDEVMAFLFQGVDEQRKDNAISFYKGAASFASGKSNILGIGGGKELADRAQFGAFPKPTLPEAKTHAREVKHLQSMLEIYRDVMNVFEYELSNESKPTQTPAIADVKIATLNRIDADFDLLKKYPGVVEKIRDYDVQENMRIFNLCRNSTYLKAHKHRPAVGFDGQWQPNHTKRSDELRVKFLGNAVQPGGEQNQNACMRLLAKDAETKDTAAATQTHGQGSFDSGTPKRNKRWSLSGLSPFSKK